MAYIFTVWPHAERRWNLLEVVNELLLVVLAYSMIFFIGTHSDQSLYDFSKTFTLVLILLILALNTTVLAVNLIRDIKIRFKKWYADRKALKNQ